MSYLVLARKYRPQVFEDVVGQAHVTRTLANAIEADRVAHAYLFCGPRGVGKTTAARILAKALNCEKGPAPVPCNTCEACRQITEGSSFDVLEIDGASNRGINEVRELRENTRYAASGGRSKVYIIDEVHMLTNEAFNALLKTLEEPPSHVVFVLATTEPFKVPATILSRCQRFDFARIPSRAIGDHITTLMGSEGVEADPEAIALVARRAQGGLRDALSLMDQVIASQPGAIDRGTVEAVLGLVGTDVYRRIVDCLAEQDAAGALAELHGVYARGAGLGEVVEGLGAYLRDLFLISLPGDVTGLLEATETDLPALTTQSTRFSTEALGDLLEQASHTAAELRRSDHPLLLVELALAEMARVNGRVPLAELADRLLALEARLGGGSPSGQAGQAGAKTAPPRKSPAAPRETRTSAPQPAAPVRSQPAARPAEAPSAEKPEPAQVIRLTAESSPTDVWAALLETLRGRSMRLWGTFHAAVATAITPAGALAVRSDSGGHLVEQALDEPACQELLAELLAELGAPAKRVGLEGRLESKVEAAGDSAAESSTPQGEAQASAGPKPKGKPRARKDQVSDDRSMGQLFKEEPMLQKALDMFDGEVLP